MTKVSAIIPAFNVEGFGAETIENALAQTHEDLDVIVVDDGSTDKTLSILRSFGDAIKTNVQSVLCPLQFSAILFHRFHDLR